MTPPETLIHDTADLLVHATAARLVTRLTDLQAQGRVPALALTGGSIANEVYRAVADSPAQGAVDWSRVDLWWGDERFVPAEDDQRNALQARRVMLDRLPVDPARVHEMPASDGPFGDDVDAAAAGYAEELRRAIPAEEGAQTPLFDLILLGIGEDGHCASLMPGQPTVHDERSVVPVRTSPKPPPTRISLSMGMLNRAREIWWIASGKSKATPVSRALDPSTAIDEVPAAGPKGLDRTLWLLDREAAAAL
jgi:6-phosphogluconolactonase